MTTMVTIDELGLSAELAPVDQSRSSWAPRRIDAMWWTTMSFDGQQLTDALRRRDVSIVFRFLKTRGWSTSAISAATGLSENRVRAVAHGRQAILSYDVLERVALGLDIDRGLMGLAYTGR